MSHLYEKPRKLPNRPVSKFIRPMCPLAYDCTIPESIYDQSQSNGLLFIAISLMF